MRRGGEDLTPKEWGKGQNWHSNKLRRYILYTELKGDTNELILNWAPTNRFPVVTVAFKNKAMATYYSKDGEVCDVTIHTPAADVESVTARA